MGDNTGISWCDATANVIVGCSVKSDGCGRCYAQRLAGTRLRHLPVYEGTTKPSIGGPEWTGVVNFHPSNIEKMMRWDRPRRIFLTAVSDPFHEALTNEDVAALFGFMAARPGHTFQVLTKRPERFAEWFAWVEKRARDGLSMYPDESREWLIRQMLRVAAGRKARKLGIDVNLARKGDKHPEDPCGEWPLANVELFVSVEDQPTADERIPLLLAAPAAVHGVSMEPLLEAVVLREEWIAGLDQIILGGESGPGARLSELAWSRAVLRQTRGTRVKTFFKQAGANVTLDGVHLKLASSKGGDIAELPEEFRVQELTQREAL